MGISSPTRTVSTSFGPATSPRVPRSSVRSATCRPNSRSTKSGRRSQEDNLQFGGKLVINFGTPHFFGVVTRKKIAWGEVLMWGCIGNAKFANPREKCNAKRSMRALRAFLPGIRILGRELRCPVSGRFVRASLTVQCSHDLFFLEF